eukprot:gene20572-7531_t
MAGDPFKPNYDQPTPVALLAQEKKLPSPIFSICLNEKAGGKLTIGGEDPSLRTGEFQYTPYHEPLFSMTAKSINIGGHAIAIQNYPSLILDSGTNVFLAPSDIFAAIKQTLTSNEHYCRTLPHLCKQNDGGWFAGKCYPFSEKQAAAFPPINLVLDGATLQIPGSQYIIVHPTEKNTYCLGIIEVPQ